MKYSATLFTLCLLFTHGASADQSNVIQNYNGTGAIPDVQIPPPATETPSDAATATPPESAAETPPAVAITPLETAAALPAPAAPLTETSKYSDYALSPGDTLEISVWKEEGMKDEQYLISPDGTIIFPLIGPVLAAGKTITQLKETLTAKLADYISSPSVTVKLLNNQGNIIFVIGKVQRPGQFYTGRRIDVLQALSLAGGVTVFANESRISILRRVGNQIKVFPFDYSDVIKGDDLEQNILLEPGDTVTVP